MSKCGDGVHLSEMSGQISMRGTRGDVILNRNERITLFLERITFTVTGVVHDAVLIPLDQEL